MINEQIIRVIIVVKEDDLKVNIDTVIDDKDIEDVFSNQDYDFYYDC